MSAISPEGNSLARAQQEIEVLLERLNHTVEVAGALVNTGQDEEALALLARERKHLHIAVDNVSRDIAVDRPSVARRKILIFAAAALTAASLSTFAFAAMESSDHTPATDVRRDLRDAIAIDDPIARAEAIEQVRKDLAALPPSQERAAIQGDIDEAVDNERTMEEKADRVRRDVEMMTESPSEPPNEQEVKQTQTDVEDLLG